MDEKSQNQASPPQLNGFTSNPFYKIAKKVFIFIVGMTVVIFGCILFFTPGPALVVIPIGLLILSTEFLWAKKILKWMTKKFESARNAIKNRKNKNSV